MESGRQSGRPPEFARLKADDYRCLRLTSDRSAPLSLPLEGSQRRRCLRAVFLRRSPICGCNHHYEIGHWVTFKRRFMLRQLR